MRFVGQRAAQRQPFPVEWMAPRGRTFASSVARTIHASFRRVTVVFDHSRDVGNALAPKT
jgi:hypothetical protein